MVLPLLVTAFGWEWGWLSWVSFPVTATLLTLGPEVSWGLAKRELGGEQ